MPRHPPEERPFPMPLFPLHNNTLHQPLPMLPVLPPYHLALPSSPGRSESDGRNEYLFASNRRWRVLRKAAFQPRSGSGEGKHLRMLSRALIVTAIRAVLAAVAPMKTTLAVASASLPTLLSPTVLLFLPPPPFFLKYKAEKLGIALIILFSVSKKGYKEI